MYKRKNSSCPVAWQLSYHWKVNGAKCLPDPQIHGQNMGNIAITFETWSCKKADQPPASVLSCPGCVRLAPSSPALQLLCNGTFLKWEKLLHFHGTRCHCHYVLTAQVAQLSPSVESYIPLCICTLAAKLISLLLWRLWSSSTPSLLPSFLGFLCSLALIFSHCLLVRWCYHSMGKQGKCFFHWGLLGPEGSWIVLRNMFTLPCPTEGPPRPSPASPLHFNGLLKGAHSYLPHVFCLDLCSGQFSCLRTCSILQLNYLLSY